MGAMAEAVRRVDGHLRDHEWRDEHLKLLQTNERTAWYRMLEWCLFVHDFDPYAIFKGQQSHEQQRESKGRVDRAGALGLCREQDENARQNLHSKHHDSLYGSKELRMHHTSRDTFRHRTTRLLRLFSIYYLIKVVVIAIAQHTLMRHEYLVPKNQSQPLMSLESCQMIEQRLGNPFGALKDIALMLYVGPAGFCTMCVVLLPIYYRRLKPMNIAQLRFVLDPRRELKRVDASIRYRLAAFRSSLRVYKQSQCVDYELARSLLRAQPCAVKTNSRQDKRPSDFLWLEELRGREDRYCQMIEKYLDELGSSSDDPNTGLESLRPCTFSPSYYVALVGQMEKALLGSQAGYTLCWFVLSSSLVYSAYSNKCPTLDCHPGRVFSWPETLVIVETLSTLAVTNLSSTLNATLFNALAASQLELIKSIGAELRLCNEAIHSFLGSQRSAGITPSTLEAAGHGRDEVEKLLLKSLIRLMINDRELRDNSQCISEQTLHPFYYVGGALLLAATGAQFKSHVSDSNFLRWFMVFVIWFSFNQVAVACANIYARLLESERQLWSVLATSSHLFMSNYYEHEIGDDWQLPSRHKPSAMNGHLLERECQLIRRVIGGKSCSFVADLWFKFVHSTSANVEQHCARLFNVELNYQTIIEANFFSIFIYSLTLSPGDK